MFVPDRVTPGEMTRRIAEVVRELGLQPWKPPDPLDPIEEEEVNLVVWMGVMNPDTPTTPSRLRCHGQPPRDNHPSGGTHLDIRECVHGQI